MNVFLFGSKAGAICCRLWYSSSFLTGEWCLIILRAHLKIGFRRLFAFEQSPIGKIFGGYVQVATLKSSCIGLFAHPLKIHPIEFLEIPLIDLPSVRGSIPARVFAGLLMFG